ncbi:hypothetical protein [Corynebacterium mucifaciens]|uniref:Uncharacterized protein n=1 Tax=Corynebacterium mucifaciens TaxID=57171 RepID=A0A7X6LSN4_9CORY|nr:hypothetical protein [Corynebacterium mucifaciens]NKY69608.1 hypothetical protein [Corynebacterium mucifaciens]
MPLTPQQREEYEQQFRVVRFRLSVDEADEFCKRLAAAGLSIQDALASFVRGWVATDQEVRDMIARTAHLGGPETAGDMIGRSLKGVLRGDYPTGSPIYMEEEK